MEMGSTGGATGATGGAEKRWYQSASFWLGPFMWITGIFVGLVIGIGWYVLGGFPRDHDAYGAVAVPGQAVLDLPDGDIRLYFENEAFRSGDTSHIEDQPEGLDVRVTSASGGEEFEIEDVPSWIFSATGDDRGHEPYAKVDIPEAGDYLVQATDAASGGFAKPAPKGAVAEDAGPEITVGKSPWNPLDSKFLGAILAGLAVVLVLAMFTLPFRFVGRSS